MKGFRFGPCCVALMFALAIVQASYSQFHVPPVTHTGPLSNPTKIGSTQSAVSRVYSLADLSDDPNLCKWVAETIPQMIKPGCWNGQNLCYYAPAKVMAIHQSQEVHTLVEDYLANLRKTLPRAKTAASPMKQDGQVVQAQFSPESLRPVGPPTASQAYPVPAGLQTPKHLFHFIIRYEGEGIIDSNVTKFAQALTNAASSNANVSHSNAPLPSAVNLPHPPNSLVPIMPASHEPPMGNPVPMMPSAPRVMPSADGSMSSSTSPTAPIILPSPPTLLR